MRLSPRCEAEPFRSLLIFTHSLRLSPAGSSAIRVRRQGADHPRLVAFFVYCVRNRSAAKTIVVEATIESRRSRSALHASSS
jgi:hypothetical protein